MFQRLTHNWALKLLSLFLAVLLWVLVVGQDKAEVTIKALIEVTNIPKQAVLSGDTVGEVELRLSGPSSLLRRLSAEGLSRVVDLAGAKLGEHQVDITPGDFKLPPGIEINRIAPARVVLTLKKKASRKVTVRPVFKGKPAQGYKVDEVVFTPSKVEITGSAEEVSVLDWVWTVPIDITGIKKDLSSTISLQAPKGGNLRLGVLSVKAKVILEANGNGPEPASKKKAKKN